MKKLKIIILFSYFITFISVIQIHAKSKMLKLNKVKEKTKTVTSKKTKQTKESFNQILESQKKDKNFRKEKSKLYQLTDAIKLSNNSQIKGLDIYKHIINKKIDAAQKFVENVKWGLEVKPTQTYLKNHEKGIKILCDKIIEKYAESKSPLINFAITLDEEQKQSKDHLEKLSKYIQNNQQNNDYKQNALILENTIEKLLKIQNNIDKLIEMINKLIDNEN